VSLFPPRTRRTPSIIAKMDSIGANEASGGGQVLLVEDDDEVAALTVEMIKQLGYDATRVSSAEAALGAMDAAGRNAIAQRIKIIPKPYRMDQLRDALAAAARDARTSVREH
jgi:hypothetical protein